MIVKHSPTSANHLSVVKRVVNDARATAEALVEQATLEAQQVRAALVQEVENARQQGFQEGWQHALEKWDSYLLAAREHRDQALAQAETELLQLAVKVAEKIIGRELQTHPATAAYIALTALQHARQSELITLRANPADVATLESFREHFAQHGRIKFVDIIPDHHIEAGGCRIETEVGTVDAQINVQLRALGRALLARREEPQQ